MRICSSCHIGRFKPSSIAYIEWHGDQLLVANQIPAVVCDMCGERDYDDQAIENLQRLLWSKPAGPSRAASQGNS